MSVKSMDLSWIVVSDLEKTKGFFREVLGLKIKNSDEGYGWAEAVGSEGGSLLGIAQADQEAPLKPGDHAVVTFTVDDLDQMISTLVEKGVPLIGEIQIVPGHVKLQLFKDPDGNLFQLVQKLD